MTLKQMAVLGRKEAVGVVDESGVAKSGNDTVGVSRQWNGNRGKVDNCVVGVHLSYAAPGFQCLLGSGLFLPESWANDPERRKKTTCRTRCRSAPSRRSPWRLWIAPWATACGCRACPPGASTPYTAARASFWTPWRLANRSSWPRCPSISTAGSNGRKSCGAGRKEPKTSNCPTADPCGRVLANLDPFLAAPVGRWQKTASIGWDNSRIRTPYPPSSIRFPAEHRTGYRESGRTRIRCPARRCGCVP